MDKFFLAANALVKNGAVMAVIRPSDPARAIAAAKKCKTQEELNAVLQDPKQTYTFVGIASKHGEDIYDTRTGEVIDGLKPGDSFVPLDQLQSIPPAGAA